MIRLYVGIHQSHGRPNYRLEFALMSYAIHNFNNEGTNKINHCRIYLQVIMADLLTFDCTRIHPGLLRHTPIFSRDSNIKWIRTERPPKSYWNIWDKSTSSVLNRLKTFPLHRMYYSSNHYCHNYSFAQDMAFYTIRMATNFILSCHIIDNLD
jgi:hypothetical protein